MVYVCRQPQWWYLHVMVWFHAADCIRWAYRVVARPLKLWPCETHYTPIREITSYTSLMSASWWYMFFSSPKFLHLHAMVWLQVEDCVRGAYCVVIRLLKVWPSETHSTSIPMNTSSTSLFGEAWCYMFASSLTDCIFFQCCDCMRMIAW